MEYFEEECGDGERNLDIDILKNHLLASEEEDTTRLDVEAAEGHRILHLGHVFKFLRKVLFTIHAIGQVLEEFEEHICFVHITNHVEVQCMVRPDKRQP
jgi:hypothetical protein